MKQVKVTLSEAVYGALLRLAAITGQSQSEILRQALLDRLREHLPR